MPALATSILWRLSEYDDFGVPLLKAGAAAVCATVVKELGYPRDGPLQYWLQISVQVGAWPVRPEYVFDLNA